MQFPVTLTLPCMRKPQADRLMPMGPIQAGIFSNRPVPESVSRSISA